MPGPIETITGWLIECEATTGNEPQLGATLQCHHLTLRHHWWLLFFALLFPATLFADTIANNISLHYPEYPPVQIETGSDKRQIKRGEYLVKLGDCMACHTDTHNGGTPFSGGLRIDTPFGSLFAPNITPDKATGIGSWSEDDFVAAMREGIRPDGSYYFPVFPYNYFSRMSREDVLAIKAYLDRIPAQKHANTPPQMTWPFNYRWLQFGWRLLYFDFDNEAYKDDPQQSERWNRGAFIIEGPGHCTLCHTELNMLGPRRRSTTWREPLWKTITPPASTRKGYAICHLEPLPVSSCKTPSQRGENYWGQ